MGKSDIDKYWRICPNKAALLAVKSIMYAPGRLRTHIAAFNSPYGLRWYKRHRSFALKLFFNWTLVTKSPEKRKKRQKAPFWPGHGIRKTRNLKLAVRLAVQELTRSRDDDIRAGIGWLEEHQPDR